jgi:mannosyl-3-phosphoglycerate phosphatase
MIVRAILTDLDGTLLEPDGTVCPEVLEALALLQQRRVPVLPVSSKTAAEVRGILARVGLPGPAGFENGAGVVTVAGEVMLRPAALSAERLREVALELRRQTGCGLRTMEEMGDVELSALTGLTGEEVRLARQRQATLPLLVGQEWDAVLREAAPEGVMLVRGNRFLHLQGRHTKADVVPALLATVPGHGAVVGCGDSPNDCELLQRVDVPVIVPSTAGAHAVLRGAFPDALVAPVPHGRGWARAVLALCGL